MTLALPLRRSSSSGKKETGSFRPQPPRIYYCSAICACANNFSVCNHRRACAARVCLSALAATAFVSASNQRHLRHSFWIEARGFPSVQKLWREKANSQRSVFRAPVWRSHTPSVGVWLRQTILDQRSTTSQSDSDASYYKADAAGVK